MKTKILILFILLMALAGCGSSSLFNGGESNSPGRTVDGTVSRIINIVFPSAYAAKISRVSESPNPTKSFTAELSGVTNAATAFTGVLGVILNDFIAGGSYEVHNLSFSNKDAYSINGFTVVKCFNEQNELEGIVGAAIDENGHFKMDIPATLDCSISTFESFYQKTEGAALINRQGVDTAKSSRVLINAQTSMDNTKFMAAFQDQLDQGDSASDISLSATKNLLVAAQEETLIELNALGVSAAKFDIISHSFMKLLPLMAESVALADELQSDSLCAQDFVNTYLKDGGTNLASIETKAPQYVLAATNAGARLTFEYFADLLAAPTEWSSALMTNVNTDVQDAFVVYINNYFAMRDEDVALTTDLQDSDGNPLLGDDGQPLVISSGDGITVMNSDDITPYSEGWESDGSTIFETVSGDPVMIPGALLHPSTICGRAGAQAGAQAVAQAGHR